MSLYDAYVGIGQEFSSVTSALEAGKMSICVTSSIVDDTWIISDNNITVTLRPNVVVTIKNKIVADSTLTLISGTLIFMSSNPIVSSSSLTINDMRLIMLSSSSTLECTNLTINQSKINSNYLYCSIANDVNVSITNCRLHGIVALYSGTYDAVKILIENNVIEGSIILFPNMSYLPDTVGYPISYRIVGNDINVLSLSANILYDMSYFLGVVINSNTIGTLTTTGGSNTIGYSEIYNNNITTAMLYNTSTYDTTISENTIVSSVTLTDVELTNITSNTMNEIAIRTMNRSTFNNNTLVDLYITSINSSVSNNGSTINMNNLAGSIVSETSMYGCEVKNNFSLGSIAFNASMVNNNVSSNWCPGLYYNSTCQSDKITDHYNTSITFNGTVHKAIISDNDAFNITCNGQVTNSKILNNNMTLVMNDKNLQNNIESNTGTLICNGRTQNLILTSNNYMSVTFNKKIKDSIITNNILSSPLNMSGKRNVVMANINGSC